MYQMLLHKVTGLPLRRFHVILDIEQMHLHTRSLDVLT